MISASVTATLLKITLFAPRVYNHGKRKKSEKRFRNEKILERAQVHGTKIVMETPLERGAIRHRLAKYFPYVCVCKYFSLNKKQQYV